MPKFVIERSIPGAGDFSQEKWAQLSQTSCNTLREMGPDIQWVQSFVTTDKVYCIYIAPDEATIREHARRAGFPADRVTPVARIIDPTTSELTQPR
jgi:hypothetical protein